MIGAKIQPSYVRKLTSNLKALLLRAKNSSWDLCNFGFGQTAP